jgi:hypothetical protein
MRRALQGRSALVAAFVLGLAIATAGTATAGRLITGRQIKDGSIKKRDLAKSIRAQIAKAGRPGPGGPKGESGAKGEAGSPGAPGEPFTAATVLRAGETESGSWYVQEADVNSTVREYVAFRVPLPASLPIGNVHFVDEAGNSTFPECAGPGSAAPGHLCVYETSHLGWGTFGSIYSPETGAANGTSAAGFVLTGQTGGVGGQSGGSWTLTAPSG